MPKLLAISDWDHCLFRTEEFWQAVTDLLERHYGNSHGIMADQFRAERLDRSPGGPGRVAEGEGYDFFLHLSQHGIDPDEAEKAIMDELSVDQWLYPGTTELIANLRRRGYTFVIETTGAVHFQALKIACAANLPTDIPTRAMPGNKGQVLRQEWNQAGRIIHRDIAYTHVLLIDDSAGTFEALGEHPGLTAIQITGREKNPEPSPLNWVHKVKDLSEIPALLRQP